MAGQLDRDTDDMSENHEINVTPFIDVILVLLIIFMVAAPLSTVDVPVDLPSSSAKSPPPDEKPLFLTIQADLALSLGDHPVQPTQLIDELAKSTNGDKTRRIFLRGDKAVPYGEVMTVLDRLRDAGYLKVALVGLETAK
jgi:biopolymer transport protein ExbD